MTVSITRPSTAVSAKAVAKGKVERGRQIMTHLTTTEPPSPPSVARKGEHGELIIAATHPGPGGHGGRPACRGRGIGATAKPPPLQAQRWRRMPRRRAHWRQRGHQLGPQVRRRGSLLELWKRQRLGSMRLGQSRCPPGYWILITVAAGIDLPHTQMREGYSAAAVTTIVHTATAEAKQAKPVMPVGAPATELAGASASSCLRRPGMPAVALATELAGALASSCLRRLGCPSGHWPRS